MPCKAAWDNLHPTEGAFVPPLCPKASWAGRCPKASWAGQCNNTKHDILSAIVIPKAQGRQVFAMTATCTKRIIGLLCALKLPGL